MPARSPVEAITKPLCPAALQPVVLAGINRLSCKFGDQNALLAAAETQPASNAVANGGVSIKRRNTRYARAVQFQIAGDRLEPDQRECLGGDHSTQSSGLARKPKRTRFVPLVAVR
jgi:hypothetical protein